MHNKLMNYYYIISKCGYLQRFQQRCPSCSWIVGEVATAKQELLMVETAIYDM